MATTCGVIRWRCARPRFEVCWPKLALACASTSTWKGDGPTVFAHACKMGLEGIVSKRLGSRYPPGRSTDWLKFKKPAAPAVKREAEEDWGREKWRYRQPAPFIHSER